MSQAAPAKGRANGRARPRPTAAAAPPVLALERALVADLCADAEVTIGALLSAGCEAGDFPTAGAIVEAALALAKAGAPVDLMTLMAELEARGEPELMRSLNAATDPVVGELPNVAAAGWYAARLREAALRRRLVAAATAAGEGNGDGLAELEQLTGELRRLGASGGEPWRAITAEELLALPLPPRAMLLEPWLPARGLAMVHGPRGQGKTRALLGVALAVAAGGTFLRWKAPRATGVLYVDAELPAGVFRGLLADTGKALGVQPIAPVRVLSADLQARSIPDLATVEGQGIIEDAIASAELVILDNLSSLVRSGIENESESWQPIQDWFLALRRRGVAVVFAHHSGKGGQQRGTSRREDVVDSVLALRRPSDWTAADGARFECHFEKCRPAVGKVVEPFEAKLELLPDGRPTWTLRDLEDRLLEEIVNLKREGLSTRAIAREVGRDHSRVVRHLRRAHERRLL